jgi:hypothetical protein
VARIADRDATKRLNPLGDLVDEFDLLLGMLIEQKMQLIKRSSAHEPMMLLVERVQDLAVGQGLVQSLTRIKASVIGEAERKLPCRAESLNLPAVLVQPRLTPNATVYAYRCRLCHNARLLFSRAR